MAENTEESAMPANCEYGENVYIGHVSAYMEDVIRTWYNEVTHYDFNDPFLSQRVKHFTQLVWKDSREIGVAMLQRFARI